MKFEQNRVVRKEEKKKKRKKKKELLKSFDAILKHVYVIERIA